MLKSQKFTMKIPWPPSMFGFTSLSYRKFVCLMLFCLLFLPSARLELGNFSKKPSLEIDSPSASQLGGTEFDSALINEQECPSMIGKYFANVQPGGGYNGEHIKYSKKDMAQTKEQCVQLCCFNPQCSVVFMYLNNTQLTCFHASCTSDELCLPVKPNATNVANRLKDRSLMVLVRPLKASSWLAIDPNLEAKSDQQPALDELLPHQLRACEVGLDKEECQPDEYCKPSGSKSRSGICECKEGYSRSKDTKACVQDIVQKPEVIKVEVQVHSKQISLPENKASLTAFAIPEPIAPNFYNYEWNLISGQKNGLMENRQNQTLSLSQLVEGIYQFKVTVTGGSPPVFGEGLGNITVLPPERINKPPKAIVSPVNQTINLPTKKAILDASASSDDTKDITYKWEIISSPLGYEPGQIPELPLVTLENLIAGNYTLKVTVTDQDQASDSALAKLFVLEEEDYPPKAIAGEDIVIFLPNNEVTLHGNQSYDDHGIVSWEWTRGGDQDLAADTKDMRTPHPVISNLEEGVYTFHLKVTDAKGQSSEDDVNIYVKKNINQPPVVNAGKNKTISLPQNWVVLDGSESTDDVGISSYLWSQLEGPNDAIFAMANQSVTNVTGLTKGSYLFKLAIRDSDKNEATATVGVVVNQDTNESPIAIAGNDVEVTLPQSVVIVNGSSSHDDLRIARWRWTRDPRSLAAGKIVGNSSQEAVLYLVNLVPGQYIFNLKVWDDQGKSSEDTISILVRENPSKKHVIQAVLEVNITALVQSHVDDFCQSVGLLLRGDESESTTARVRVLNILPQQNTNYAILQFLVELVDESDNIKIMPGVKAVNELKMKLRGGADILDLKLVELDTLVCQNDCSGHGYCQQATRTCVCESFWIENFFRRLSNGNSNCEWSVIYVGIFISFLLAGSICGVIYLSFKKKGKPARTRRRYSRLEQNEQNFELRNAHTSSLMMSDSDSEDEDEIIFDDDHQLTPKNGTSLSKRNGIPKPKTKLLQHDAPRA